MRQIIEGKMYDTDTAHLVGREWNGKTGLQAYEEDLYEKENGEFFLHRYGGALTSMGHPYGDNTYTGDEDIVPYTEDEAQKWAEKYADIDDYIAIWGCPAE